MNSKNMSLKEFFERVIRLRKELESEVPYPDYVDRADMFNMLMKDYVETVEFLTNANKYEIGCAIDVLEDLVDALTKEKAKTVLSVFKQKQEEFPDIYNYTVVDYPLELQIAQDIIDGKEE